jgi:hypothetical protein
MDNSYRQLSAEDSVQDGNDHLPEKAKAPVKKTEVPTTDSTSINDNLRTASNKPQHQSDGASFGTTSLKKGASAKAAAIARIQDAQRMGNPRPLSTLAGRETALHEHSAGLAKLSDFDESRPDPDLLVDQLMKTVAPRGLDSHQSRKIKGEALALYSSLGSRSPLESMIDRVMVGINIATMDCLARVPLSDSRAREVNLRYAMQGAATLIDLVKLRDARRGQGPQNVSVGNVKVEAGGQAIVGNVQTKGRRKRANRAKSVRRPEIDKVD